MYMYYPYVQVHPRNYKGELDVVLAVRNLRMNVAYLEDYLSPLLRLKVSYKNLWILLREGSMP